MLTKIEIENFKSIYKESIELGRVNVFIGENGCGKTNVLEAVGMASAAVGGRIKNDILASKGLRISKPSLTVNSFRGKPTKNNIEIKFAINNADKLVPFFLTIKDINDIYAKWRRRKIQDEEELVFEYEEGVLAEPRALYGEWLNNLKYLFDLLDEYVVYQLKSDVLRGIGGNSYLQPGIHGENLDALIAGFSNIEFEELLGHAHFISWLDDMFIDKEGVLRAEGHNLNLSQSKLYFRDKFMQKKNNIFSAENANEGILHILFYLALFISKKTPKFFAIDNIETALNPHLCREVIEVLIPLAKKNDKQVLITTHNPAILDGLNLHDDEVRLFVVERDFKGHTRVERKKLKPNVELNGRRLKLSELWMRGYLGAIPQHF
ncbi:MAG TPA: DUF2813 domain-containing protein [Bacteroidetes bacterium]|nr:DUF2813 domain-containing protein [Bacteroidota bacterium]